MVVVVGVTVRSSRKDGYTFRVIPKTRKWELVEDKVVLEKGKDGIFRTTLKLPPGTYQYKFVVDGTWVADPANPETVDDGYGGVNSVLTAE